MQSVHPDHRCPGARWIFVLLLVGSLVVPSGPAHAWSSYRVNGYTLDINLKSQKKASVRLVLTMEVLGGRFRGFKIARADEGLSWAKTGLYCENSSGKRYVLRRIPRADGLTQFKFVTPGFIPRGAATCQMTYEFDPAEAAALTLVTRTQGETSAGMDMFRMSYKTPGLPVAVENWVTTLHFPDAVEENQILLGEFTDEEYTVEHYPRAITLKRYRPPAYYTGNVDVTLPAELLGEQDGAEDSSSAPSILHLEKFIGVPDAQGGTDATHLVVYSVLALLAWILLALKHRSVQAADALASGSHPYLVLPNTGILLRLGVSGVVLALFVVLAVAGHVSSAAVTLAAAICLNLRAGLVISPREPDGEKQPDRWQTVSEEELIGRLRIAAAHENRARGFLDATTIGGAVILISCIAALAAFRLLVLPDDTETADRVICLAAVVLAFVMLTSTRLGGAGQITRRSFIRLRSLYHTYDADRHPPQLCMRQPDSASIWPDLRCRVHVQPLGNLGDAVQEVGVEWKRGILGFSSSYAVIIRLGARAGALVADAPWLERAEVHSKIDEGMTAIVVRSRDPLLPEALLEKVELCLGESPKTSVVSDAISALATPTAATEGDAARP